MDYTPSGPSKQDIFPKLRLDDIISCVLCGEPAPRVGKRARYRCSCCALWQDAVMDSRKADEGRKGAL